MIGIIVVTVLGIVEEVKLQGVGGRADTVLHLGHGAELLHSVVTILCGIHHRGVLRREGPAHTQLGIDARSHRVTALGVDEDNAVGTAGTIEGGGILQHRHLVDVLGRDGAEHIKDVAQMQRATVALHVKLHAVENHQRLGIGTDRIDTTDKHGGTVLKVARVHVHADVATELLGHLLVDGQAVAVGGKAVLGGNRGTILIHRVESIAQEADFHQLLVVAGLDGHLLRQVRGCLHKE